MNLIFAYHTNNFSKDSNIKYYYYVRGIGFKNKMKDLYISDIESYLNRADTKEKYPSLYEN